MSMNYINYSTQIIESISSSNLTVESILNKSNFIFNFKEVTYDFFGYPWFYLKSVTSLNFKLLSEWVLFVFTFFILFKSITYQLLIIQNIIYI